MACSFPMAEISRFNSTRRGTRQPACPEQIIARGRTCGLAPIQNSWRATPTVLDGVYYHLPLANPVLNLHANKGITFRPGRYSPGKSGMVHSAVSGRGWKHVSANRWRASLVGRRMGVCGWPTTICSPRNQRDQWRPECRDRHRP